MTRPKGHDQDDGRIELDTNRIRELVLDGMIGHMHAMVNSATAIVELESCKGLTQVQIVLSCLSGYLDNLIKEAEDTGETSAAEDVAAEKSLIVHVIEEIGRRGLRA